MSQETRLFDAPIEEDLKPLSVYWWQQQLPHRISEQSGRQIVWSATPVNNARMLHDYQAYCRGELQIQLQARPRSDSRFAAALAVISRYPITLSLVLLSVLGFLLVEWDDSRALVNWFTIQAVGAGHISQEVYAVARVSPESFMQSGQYWRLVTPIFLHFGLLHLTFNMIWLWELGRRIEQQGGAVHYLSIVFFIAVISNLYQAASTPFAYFGGMSGVIFGLLGYCAVFNTIAPRKLLELPRQYYVIMLLTLVVGWLGVFDFLAKVANTAHTSGFLWGCAIAIPSALLVRFMSNDESSAS